MRVEREIEVVNKLGLHARAAAKLVKLSASFESQINLAKGDKSVDSKSIMGVLMLAAAQGSALKLIAEGADAEKAADGIEQLFQDYFGEGE
jgi:phosphocarrier protein HPr